MDPASVKARVLVISIARDFSRFPAGRFRSDGPYSGQQFRDELLAPALMENDRVEVVLDGTRGYGSSFLEETFGGLIRMGFSPEDLQKKLFFKSEEDPTLETEIREYIADASAEQARN